LPEWNHWIKENFYAIFDITEPWGLLLQQQEFEDIWDDYPEDRFKLALETIRSREGISQKLFSFCNAILINWDKHVNKIPNKSQMNVNEKGTSFLPFSLILVN
jgi:hypothetical protein